ncbi:MAG: helix-turn-helix transcriptional regulator [Gammaproteobacteria bacterium]|nr:helix-turn-helix transcriptional regulator [Gammaproteobacteria bacterium]
MNAEQQLSAHKAGSIADSIQRQAFRTDAVYDSYQDAQASAPGYDIEVHKLNLPTSGRGVYYSERHCFLEYVEAPGHCLSARYPDSDEPRSIGQLIFIPPGFELEWCWEKGVQRTVTCMFEVERIAILSGYDWRWDAVDVARTFDIQNSYLLMGMRKLGEEACRPGFASELQIENMLALMAVELQREFVGRSAPVAASCGRLSTCQLKRVRDYIYASLGDELSVDRIARHCDLSERELSEQFKNTVGMTLRQFVAMARVDRAKLLLADPRLMVKQVGYECGFKGAAAFVAAFRKATGVTPAEYRKRYM